MSEIQNENIKKSSKNRIKKVIALSKSFQSVASKFIGHEIQKKVLARVVTKIRARSHFNSIIFKI